MSNEITRLRNQIKDLETANSDLEIKLLIATDHGDAIEEELHAINSKLREEIQSRIVAERRLTKVLEAISRQKEDLEILVETITQHSDEIDIQWLKRISEVERLARIDPLTQIGNRRFLDEAFEREWRRCSRNRDHISLCMLDVDNFKLYNDHYGHQKGDDVLASVAAILKSSLNRKTDVCARIGGEEFAVLLPETELEGAVTIAEKIRTSVSGLNIPQVTSAYGHVTISIGVSSCIPNPAMDYAVLYAKADELLYKAKSDGRNCLKHLILAAS